VSDLTVVVATRNRRERLAETLDRHEAPVILVDNASDDGTPGYVRHRYPHVRVVRLDRNEGAAARNVGVRLAGTPFVAFADDDSYWAAGALDRAAGLLRAYPRAGLLAARILVGPEARLDPVSAAMAAAPLGLPPGEPGPPVLGFLACAAAVRREAFLTVGGFQAALHVYGEEALLAMDLAAAGWCLSYVDELVVRHLPSTAGRDQRARHRMEARNGLLTAVLRRPGQVVARTMVEVWRDGAARHALLDAARALPWALRERRLLPPQVERSQALLEGGRAAALHRVRTR
jgi:GT2 family glycosyltransferase